MTDLREAARQALEALTSRDGDGWTRRFARDRAIEALEAALAQAQTEPFSPGDIARTQAAWKMGYEARKAEEHAEPAQEPVAWLRVIDDAMVTHHLGVADLADDYETAKRKMNELLCCAQDIGAYFAAAPRKPLAEEEIQDCFHAARNAKLGASKDNSKHRLSVVEIARAIEAAHGIIETEIKEDKA